MSNENKIPLKTLSNEEDAQKIKEWTERLKGFIPRIRQGPYYSATTITTTGASSQTISPSGVPDNAIGAVILAQVDTTNSVYLQWRQDSSDGTWKPIGISIGARTSHTMVGFVYFTDGGSSYDITWSGAIGTAGTIQIFHACWIY